MSDRTLGVSSLIVAAAIPMFIVLFGLAGAAGMPAAAQSDARLAAAFFRDHPTYLAGILVNSIVMHVAVIALAVGLLLRMGVGSALALVGAIGGVAWGVLDIAQSSVTYGAILGAPAADPATVAGIAAAIQNAAHLFGGLWVLSIAATSAAFFGRAHRTVAVVVGAVFALHVLLVPLAPAWWSLEYIGLPLFFGWTGLALLRSRAAVAAGLQPQRAGA